ncbi:MmgE/PrpD family protein [Alloalcanivorax mobilis]|uniref:MmgE/PrpD family protein n=1 Tax=Alloalcanivorax mobilis TaxID=2019569 RepID=UPI0012FFE980|nr:MmgE/PrpD family protein [Alloalcanivorax mobilis]
MSPESENNKQKNSDITSAIVGRVRSIKYTDLNAEEVEFAKHCFLDWLGVTLGGGGEPLVKILRDEAGDDECAPRATLIGHRQRSSPRWAALINGAASHALDFDDVVSQMGGHPSVPVFPALLAQAEQRGATGKAFIAAFVAGVEAECRVGTLVSPGHYARGFHCTATVGTFGAAAACAHLACADPTTWNTAFGLAATQAAGLKCMFGTMAKPLHAGKAAAAGLFAWQLAERGFTAHPNALEAEQGFVATQADGINPAGVAGPGEPLGITGVLFKYHAACYLTHATIEALTALQSEHSFTPSQVREIVVRVPPGHLRVCNIENPQTGLQGKFSLRMTAALAFLRRGTGESMFTDRMARDADIIAVRDKVRVEAVDTLANNYSSEVSVVLTNGDTVTGHGDVSRPASGQGLAEQWRRLSDKFLALATPVIGAHRAHTLLTGVAALHDSGDIGELLSLTTPQH